MRCLVTLLGISTLLASCGSSEYTYNSYEYFPKADYITAPSPTAPDYSQEENWAALPNRVDTADELPDENLSDNQSTAGVDVFFLHPTTYAGGEKNELSWNADITDAELNEKTDISTIRHQASIFNGVGRVYAPRYRQAHLHAYFTEDTISANKAFDIAYEDVESSFLYYLEHLNEGRPFIIAAHSQGMTHAGPLIKKHIDGTELQKQLVAAYLVGLPGPADFFDHISPCEEAGEVGCWISWRTYAQGFYPKYHDKEENILCTNPLSWKRDTNYVDYEANVGTVMQDFTMSPQLFDAQVHEGVLWVGAPNAFGGFLFQMENYHIADFNLFWGNIRENSMLRGKNYLEKLEAPTTEESLSQLEEE